MRRTAVIGWSLVGLLAWTVPAHAQLSFDARRTGMAGVSLSRDGALSRFNPAYHAVPRRAGRSAKFTIPIPLGLFQVLKDSAAFDTHKSYFNPIALADYVLHPPLFYEIKKVPEPTNNVEFTIGKDSLVVDLGASAQLVPTDRFSFGGSSRLMDIGPTIKGLHVGVLLWEDHEVGFQLGDTLLGFLRKEVPAKTNTDYTGVGDGIAQAGFAPTLAYAGRVWGDSSHAIYLGAAVHYYLGGAYGSVWGTAGITTGDSLFTGPNPVTPTVDGRVQYSKAGNSFGHGFGTDVGMVYTSGPVEVGLGINDLGATLTWSDTRVDSVHFDTAANDFASREIANHVKTKTRLPVTYVANAALELGTNTTAGAEVLNNGRGTTIQLGVEQRVGPLALRGGVARDQRKRVQLAAGTGVRFGPFSLDVGFLTHSSSLSNSRGITMATSLSIY
ncbi:MAG TPA: hypothetical protein VFJ24_07100 [Gaiellales bacterium]|nr:hypothetical protein [Gaiellales bacterium]